jgi:hypothetical protein
MTTLHYHWQCQLEEAQKKEGVKLMQRSQNVSSEIQLHNFENEFSAPQKKNTISTKFNFCTSCLVRHTLLFPIKCPQKSSCVSTPEGTVGYFFSNSLTPLVGQGLLIIKASQSHCRLLQMKKYLAITEWALSLAASYKAGNTVYLKMPLV